MKRKLTYFGHTMRKHDILEKDIITGTLPGKLARGRPKTSWINNITAFTGLTINDILRKTEDIEVNGELSSGVWSTHGLRKTERRRSLTQSFTLCEMV